MSKKSKFKEYLQRPYAFRLRVLYEVQKYRKQGRVFDPIYRFFEGLFGFISICVYVLKKKKPSKSNVLICTVRNKNYWELSPIAKSVDVIMFEQTLEEYIKVNPEKKIRFDSFYWDQGLILFSTFRLFKKILCGGFGVVVFSAYRPKVFLPQPSYLAIRFLRLVTNFKLICWEPFILRMPHCPP